MTFDLRHLRHATILWEAGNFSRASEIVGISQPALSRSVARLEDDVGFAIFDRSSSGVRPTTMGISFLADARKLLLQARQLEIETKAIALGEGGALSFGVGPLLASLILPDLLVILTQRFPKLRIAPLIANVSEALSALADRKIEMCLFAEAPVRESGVQTQVVGSVSLGLLVRAGHPLAGRKRLVMKDLEDYPLATGSYGGRSVIGNEPEPTIVCENYNLLFETVLRSDAVWLSSPLMRGHAQESELVELNVTDYPSMRRNVLLARLEGRTPSRAGIEADAAILRLLS
jgi:DNA-binding transcriptional LysR family regulator